MKISLENDIVWLKSDIFLSEKGYFYFYVLFNIQIEFGCCYVI